MPIFAQKLRVDLWVFKSVWIKIRVAEAPKEGIVRVARGYTLTQKMFLVCNLRIICVDKSAQNFGLQAKLRLAIPWVSSASCSCDFNRPLRFIVWRIRPENLYSLS
jgi:hypothetical protein